MKSISEASIKRHETDPLLRKKHVSAKINKISPKQSVQNNQAGQGGVGRGGAGRGGSLLKMTPHTTNAQEFTLYRHGGCHGHCFWRKN